MYDIYIVVGLEIREQSRKRPDHKMAVLHNEISWATLGQVVWLPVFHTAGDFPWEWSGLPI